ncbi:MAG: hypothetical protein UDJ85_00300 [Clostridia bacterium]|nr:hypothetical protein [Clostridia bacterium]
MRKLNNKIKKIGAPILAGVLACSTALFYVPQMNAVHADTEKSINENFPEMLKTAQTGDKSETVYAVMDADGNTTDVSVSEWLKNEGKSNNLSDYSNLKNIKNTSGDEKMSRDGNKLVWAAKGKDIHYTGDYDGELPVKVKVSYYLNGTKVSADEIAGKKGNVKIRFDYDINDSVKENGYSLTRPYAIVSAVVLSNDNFTNVTVNNGKAVNDGNSTAVVGIALPGMSDNLQIDELDIPDHVTINAKTTNFEIDGTYTVADSGFMNDMDTTKLDDAAGQVDELESALDKLSDASKKLVNGSSKLAKGANKLADSSSQIEEGTETMKDGTESMKTGSKDLKTGTGDLKTGVKDLSDGADKLVAGAQDLSSGTTQMKEGTEALNSSVNGEGGLAGDNGSAKKLSAGAAQVDAGLKQMGKTIAAQNTKLAQTAKSISDNLDGVNTEKVNAPSSADVDGALETAIKAAAASGDQDTINALKNAKEKLGTYETNVNDTVSSVNTDKQKITTANQTAKAMYQSIAASSNDDLKKLQDGADELKAGTQALDTAVNVGGTKDGTKVPSLSKAVYGLNDGAAQLDAGVNGYTDKDGKFHPGALLGLRSLQEGIKVDTKDKTSLVTGVNKLDAGTTKLAKGAVQVDAGAGKLVTYMGQLTEGAETLSDGADTLASGMATFNKTGIQKLVSTMKDSDIKSMVNRVKATLDAASDGSFIGGKQEGQSGESKIIFKTDEVKKASKSDK